MSEALRRHWPEYLMEGAGLGLFMISAVLFTILLEHPGFPVREALPDPLLRRALMGIAMGGTAVLLIFSPWGKRSGAHFNPSVTLTFLRLRKVAPWDALFYVLFQFAGGAAAMLAAAVVLGALPADPAVRYAVTLPGIPGIGWAFAGETAISLVLMLTVLAVSNSRRIGWATGLFAGALIALWITFEAPLSGMSMNPARTMASAVPSGIWTAIWIYFTAPLLGMMMAAQIYVSASRSTSVACAKLHHANPSRCIFRCGYRGLP